MDRRLAVYAILLGLAAGCTVQPTPREYIDRQQPADVARQQAEESLRERITSLVQAIRAGDPAAAEAALGAAPDLVVIGPGTGERLSGAAQAAALLDLLAHREAASLELVHLETRVGPRASTGWFFARLEASSGTGPPIPVRVSGVYLVHEGVWQLQQAHFSVPSDAFTAPAPAAAPGSPAGGE